MKTTLKYISILILLSAFSCKKSKEKELVVEEIETPTITDEFRLEFLNHILKNKSDKSLFPYEDKNPLITFEFFKYEGYKDVSNHEIVGKPSTFPEKMSFLFKENDSTLTIKQLEDNTKFKAHKLSMYGYYYIGKKNDYTNDINLFGKDSIQKRKNYKKKHVQLILSNLIFNTKLNKAYISAYYTSNYSIEIIYIKEYNKWLPKKVFHRTQMSISN